MTSKSVDELYRFCNSDDLGKNSLDQKTSLFFLQLYCYLETSKNMEDRQHPLHISHVSPNHDYEEHSVIDYGRSSQA
jgi:hypothetical protein